MKLAEENTRSSLFPQNLKFSFLPKLGEIGRNVVKLNELFTKILKIPLCI